MEVRSRSLTDCLLAPGAQGLHLHVLTGDRKVKEGGSSPRWEREPGCSGLVWGAHSWAEGRGYQ